MVDVINEYQADFGTWYIQTLAGGQRVELNFDHEPKQEEIDDAVARLEADIDLENTLDDSVIEQPKLTVEIAIEFLKNAYTEIDPKSADLTDEQQKLMDFISNPVEILKPLPIEPIKAVK
jgi:hypothetical protein